MKIIDSSGNISEFGNLELPKIWSLVMIHEPIEGGEPYGVVEISNIEHENYSDENLLMIVALCIILGGLIVFIPAKGYLNTEEE